MMNNLTNDTVYTRTISVKDLNTPLLITISLYSSVTLLRTLPPKPTPLIRQDFSQILLFFPLNRDHPLTRLLFHWIRSGFIKGALLKKHICFLVFIYMLSGSNRGKWSSNVISRTTIQTMMTYHQIHCQYFSVILPPFFPFLAFRLCA